MRLLTDIHQHQLRLGYLNSLVLAAGRQLDSRSGLLRRFEDLIFKEVKFQSKEYKNGPLGSKQRKRRNHSGQQSNSSNQEALPFPIHGEPTARFPYLHLVWLRQPEVGDSIGAIARDRCRDILDLARKLDVIGQTYALTELGVLLRGLLLDIDQKFAAGHPHLNPFFLWQRGGLALAHLYILMRADIVLPFLVEVYARSSVEPKPRLGQAGTTVSSTRTVPSSESQPNQDIDAREGDYLIQALDHLIEAIGKNLPIEQTLDLKEVRNLRKRLESKKALDHQFVPRRRYLLDLGVIKRLDKPTSNMQDFGPTLATERAARTWRLLREDPLNQDSLIQRNFFRWAAEIYGLSTRPAENNLRRLDYFARGFPLVGREIGFTPARTVALAGCLLAIEEGVIIEVDDMFRMMAEMAKGPYRPYLHYSGGSRLDREFLIRVDVDPLRERLRQDGVKSQISRGPRK